MANEVIIRINGKDDSGAAFTSAKQSLAGLAQQGRALKGVFGKNLLGGLAGELGLLGRAGLVGGAVAGIGSIIDVALRADEATFGFAESLNSLRRSLKEIVDGPTPKFAETFKEYIAEADTARKAIAAVASEARTRLDDVLNPRSQSKRAGLTQAQSNAFDEYFDKSGKAGSDAAARIHELRAIGPQGFANRIRADNPDLDKGWAAQQGQAKFDIEMANAQSLFNRIVNESQQRANEMDGMQGAGILRNAGRGVGDLLGGVGKNLGIDALNAGRGGVGRIQEAIEAVNQEIAERTADSLREAQEIVAKNMTTKEKLQAELGRVNALGKAGMLDAKTFGRERARLDGLINPAAKGMTVEGILADRERQGTGGRGSGFAATEGRFLTMGSGILTPGETKAQAQRARQIEQQKQQLEVLKRVDKALQKQNLVVTIEDVA